jgi:hypothetical protein
MSVTTPKTALPASGSHLEDLSDSQIIDMIKRAPGDPFLTKELLHLQKQACERMSDSVQKMLAKLNEVCKEQEKASNGPISVIGLASAARQREAAGKQKREFAASLVIGALVNRDNPNWNIFDETAAPPQTANGLLALLQLKLSEPAPAPAPT